MVRPPSFDSNGRKKGAWSKEEDNILRAHIRRFGHPNWRLLPLHAGLARCGKSCRLRWVNYLKPGLKREKFTKHEEDLIIKLHAKLGKKWSAIAAKLPGRTDNEIKNYWHAHIDKRSKRSAAVTRVIGAEVPHEEKSSEFNHRTTADHREKQHASENVSPQTLSTENPQNIDALNYPASDIFSVVEPFETCFNQLSLDPPPIFLEEVFHDFGLGQNDMPIFPDSSDGGITSWNSSIAESELPLEEDTFDVVLW